MYQLYELQKNVMAPARAMAWSGSRFLTHPLNPLAQTELARIGAAALDVFHHSTHPYGKPDFGLDHTVINGESVAVDEVIELRRPFGNLLHFSRSVARDDPKLLIVAPMSGHFATLLRDTVRTMLPDHDVYITDWHNARDVPLSEGRFGLAEYTRRQKQGILQQEVLRREVFSKVAIEDQELRAYYEDHKDEFKVPSRLRIRELVITKGATPEEQAAAKAKVALVKEALAKGAGFEALVREHSEGISRTTGGDLGWMEKGLLRPDLEKAALGLQPGQTAGPLESDRDFSFVQLIEAQIDGARPFAEVKDKIMEKLQEPKAQNAIEQYMQSLRVRANIRYQVAKDRILQG